MIYYNDNNPFVVKWLKALIQADLIPKGEVDDRSITDIKPSDLKGFTQCHFFAGIGGWPYALKLAGWPNDTQTWTGSCPCQPFSYAGSHKGINDNRHLWPAFRWLIGQCKPATIFGEQVASKAGREWFDRVRLDLELMGYGVGGADLPACSVNTPHKRQRLWWVADTTSNWGNNNRSLGKKRNKESRRSNTSMGLQARFIEGPNSKDLSIPDVFCSINGLPERMDLLSGFGNSIHPYVAANFIKTFIEIKY